MSTNITSMLIEEKGVIACARVNNCVLGNSDVFSYDKVMWYEGYKFCFGGIVGESSRRMIEVSSGASCCRPSLVKGEITDDKLIKGFFKQLKESDKELPVLINNFINAQQKYLLKTWEISLL